MRKVYLSFLGTNDYLPCIYYQKQLDDEVNNVRFVQQATIRLHCRRWGPGDRIFIFTTEEAERKNWLDNGHVDKKTGEIKQCEGLRTCIQNIKKLSASIERVPIPEGKSEEEIWEIFRILFDVLKEGDQVVFDITHAFRSIPMLAIVVLNYAKVLKKITLRGIYYGAFEVLGSIPEAEKIPLEERRVPILNLTSFDQLLDWSAGIDRFLETGNADLVGGLAVKGVTPTLTETRGKDKAASTIRNMGQGLQAFTKIMATCRGPKIVKAAAFLKTETEKPAELDLLPPFVPLFEKLQKQMKPFCGDPVLDGVQASKWCLENNLVQQAYTILQETLITHLVLWSGKDINDVNIRMVVNQAVKIVSEGIPDEEWIEPASSNKVLANKFIEYFRKNKKLNKIMRNLSEYRNDLNHAGYKPTPMRADKFEKKISKLLKGVEEYLTKA